MHLLLTDLYISVQKHPPVQKCYSCPEPSQLGKTCDAVLLSEKEGNKNIQLNFGWNLTGYWLNNNQLNNYDTFVDLYCL